MKMRVLFTVLSGLKERMKDRWYILLLVTLLFSLNGYAQSRSQARSNAKKITGYVVDATGEPLTGVAIKILTGASKGTVTDIDGQFILDVNEGVPLEFSYLGYKTQTVNAKNDMRVIMSEAVEELEEVIVVGYGTMKKSDLTGSISSIGSKDFHMQPIMNTTDALMGRLSGVMVSNTSGNVDGSVKIRIRGANSINGGNDPLYVCDGVVGSDIPPSDAIESIEVLKDASATAIYGSRGANGVILITTKKGKVGKTTVAVNAFGSYAAPSNLYDMVDAYTYAQQINLINNNPYSESQLEYFKQNGGTDWQKEILKSAWRQKYNVAVDGGTSKVRYHILGEYSNNTSLIEGQRSEKYMVRSNFDIELYKNLSLEWHVNGFYKQNRNIGGSLYEGGADAILFNALTWGPTENIYESDGSYNLADQFGAMGDNPVLKMKGTDKWGKFFGVSSNAALTWQVLPELSIQYRLNIDLSNSNNYEWESADYTLSYASSSGSKSLTSNIFQNLIVNWNKSFDKHNIGVTLVGESNKYTSDGLSGRGSYFGNENLGYWGMSTGTSKEASTSWSDYALLSGIGRATYNYGGKYYATMTFRADGSSKFAKGNKWGYFPSGSLAWRLSEEQFIKDLNVFSNLKMRASYGKTGNQGVGPYSTIASLSRVGAYYTYTSKVQGYTSKVVNKNLQWEETGQFDLGLDIGLLNDRLNFTLDYYKKKTDKLLLNIATPYFLGGDNIYMNKGKVENNGFEFSVNAIALNAKDLFWEMQANFSTNKNKIVDLGGETIYGLSSSGNNDSVLSDESYILQEGLPLGELYGYKWLGIWQEKEAEEAAKFGNKPGDNKYADLKSDGTINASDRTNIGNGTPRYTWGFNSTIRYKKWDLNVLLQGVHGAEKLNVMYAMASSLYAKSRTITLREAWENSWTPENKSNKFPNVSSKTSTVYINSTQWLQDASFIRLRNLSLGYTFGKEMTKVGDFRVYLSAQNLFTITKYKGYDPEASSTLTSDVATGIDTGITPTARTYTVGVQLSF